MSLRNAFKIENDGESIVRSNRGIKGPAGKLDKIALGSMQEISRRLALRTHNISIYVLERREINAFTLGWPTPNGEIHKVALFSGLMHSLSSANVIAVIAHEMGHIVNKDVSLKLFMSTVRTVLSMAILLPAYILYYLIAGLAFVLRRITTVGIVISVVALVQGFIVLLIRILENVFLWPANLYELYICRRSEYRADAVAAATVGPNTMISALGQLQKLNDNERTSLIAFFERVKIIAATHPTIESRINAIQSRQYFVKPLNQHG
jgi:Zn-dependent protease with chaperone function